MFPNLGARIKFLEIELSAKQFLIAFTSMGLGVTGLILSLRSSRRFMHGLLDNQLQLFFIFERCLGYSPICLFEVFPIFGFG